MPEETPRPAAGQLMMDLLVVNLQQVQTSPRLTGLKPLMSGADMEHLSSAAGHYYNLCSGWK